MSLISNKKAKHDYEILDTFEAGLKLRGHEAKAIRAGKGSLRGSHVIVRGEEAFLVGANISPYQPENTPKDYDPERPRKLLLSKKEIVKLAELEKQGGLTIVPLSVYNKGRFLKIEIALVRGKKKYDKRQTLKKKEAEREMRRSLKRK